MKNKYFLLLYLIIAVIGIWFLSTSWLPRGFTLAGHDSGLALNISDFFKSRLFAWSDQGFGQDNSPHFGSIVTHGIDYLSAVLSRVPYSGNSVLVFFWLSLVFVSAFIFSVSFKDELGEIFSIIFPPLITVNFFIIQSLFIFERAKYSVLIACILMLLILMKLRLGKIGVLKGVLVSSLVLFFFNSGSWLGLPLYGGFFVLVIVFLVFQLLTSFKDHNFDAFKKVVLFLILSGIGFVLINAYSVLPYLSTFFSHDYSQLTNPAVIDQNKDWLRSISQAGSYLNFFRLQGVPDWYSGSTAVNPGHSYAIEYLKNPYLVIISFILPILAFSAFILAKKKEERRFVSFFGLLVLVSMFFMAGSHKPLGFIYEFFYTHIPGFSIFRSPYYKFGSAFVIGISFLIAFSVSRILQKMKIFGVILSFVFVTFWLGYHFVIFYPNKIFSWQPGLSTRLQVPDYVWSFKDWADGQNLNGRILLLPPVNSQWRNDAYEWGYWSLTNLPSSLSDTSFLNNDDLLTDGQNILITALYNAVKNNDEQEFYSLSSLLGVKYILLRNDVLADDSWSATEPSAGYLSNLNNFKNVNVEKSFGKWLLFKINTQDTPMVSYSNKLVSLSSGGFGLMPEYLTRGDFVFDTNVLTKPGMSSFVSEQATLFNCSSCSVDKKSPNRSLPVVNILPDSKLYVFKDLRETSAFKVAKTDMEKISLDLGFSIRRAAETTMMLRDNHDEKYTIISLQKMNLYLSDLYNLLLKNSNPQTDFGLLQRILDGLNPIDLAFKNQVGRDDFGNRGEELRTQMQGVLWQIYRIKSFYLPILSNLDELRHHNIFYVNFSNPGQYRFQLITESLPVGSDGSPIFPDAVSYEGEGKNQNLKVDVNGGAGTFGLNLDKSGNGQITLGFNNLPNLYKFGGISSQPFPTGDQRCLKGKITSFRNSSSYRINLKVSDTSQRFKFLIKSDETSLSSTNKFLHGDEEFGIDPISFGGTFSYLYEPRNAKDPAFYLCGSGDKEPKVDSVEVYEIASPSFISFNPSNNFTVHGVPIVSYSKVDPTEYKVKVDNNDGFVLILDNTFNSLWKVRRSNGTVLDETRHFTVNGYENGWLINKDDGNDFVIEYLPQKLFKIGVAVSVMSLFITFIGVIVFRRRK